MDWELLHMLLDLVAQGKPMKTDEKSPHFWTQLQHGWVVFDKPWEVVEQFSLHRHNFTSGPWSSMCTLQLRLLSWLWRAHLSWSAATCQEHRVVLAFPRNHLLLTSFDNALLVLCIFLPDSATLSTCRLWAWRSLGEWTQRVLAAHAPSMWWHRRRTPVGFPFDSIKHFIVTLGTIWTFHIDFHIWHICANGPALNTWTSTRPPRT